MLFFLSSGVLGNVIEALCEGSIISDDAFLAWQKCTDPAEMIGHAVVVTALTSFFVNLKEAHDDSSEEAWKGRTMFGCSNEL